MKLSNIIVSIIMPCYNSSKTISRSIESVLNQTYPYWELIIVDDSSSDISLNIIKNYIFLDNRIRLFRNDVNRGVAVSRNIGLLNSSGQYIAFLDSDDYWNPNKLEVQLGEMVSKNYLLTFTSYNRVNSNDTIIGKVTVTNRAIEYNDLLKSNHIAMSTSMGKIDIFKGELFDSVGHEDYLFWLKILKKNIIAYPVNVILANYRVHKNSLSSNKLIAVSYTWHIYRKKLHLSILKSTYYFIIHITKSIIKRLS